MEVQPANAKVVGSNPAGGGGCRKSLKVLMMLSINGKTPVRLVGESGSIPGVSVAPTGGGRMM